MKNRALSYWEVNSGLVDKMIIPSQSPVRETEIAIVGAGFCGSWLAYFLLKREPNLRVTIIERDFFNLGASVRNAGFLSCGNISEWLEDSKTFSWKEIALTLRARIEGIRIIKGEFGPDLPRENCGSADFDPFTKEKASLLTELNEALIDMDFEPFFEMREVSFGGRTEKIPFNRFDGEVDPCQLLLKLHERLKRMGVTFLWQTEVDKIGNGEAEITSNKDHSAKLRYQYAFVCTNAFARGLSPNTNVAPARGQIIVTSPCDTKTTRLLGYLRSGYDYFRFIGDRVLIGGGRLEFKEKEDTDSFEVTEEVKRYLIDLAGKVIGHDKFSIDYHWAGIMGLRRGGHAAISDLQKPVPLDSQTEELAGFGGWGVTLTPYVTYKRANEFLRKSHS